MMTEIQHAPEFLVREAYEFMLFLKSRREQEDGAAAEQRRSAKPDFLARQKALFGQREVAGSQEILDELRADRF